MAFTDWQLGAGRINFTGLANFADLASDNVVRISAGNTVAYALMVAPLSVAIGVWLAVLIENSTLGRAFFRSAFFLPVVSTTVAMAIVWEFLLHPSIGPLNTAIALVGLPRQSFFNNASTVLATLAAIGIWENAGYNMVLVMAGLKTIPRDLYDAAAVDGADRLYERFSTVTLPMLGPTLVFVIVISFLRSVPCSKVAAITKAGRGASEVVLFTIYQEGFVFFRVGYASALTVVFVLALLAITLAKFRLLDRKVHYG